MDNKICQIHNEPAIFCEQDGQQNLILMCRVCVQEKLKISNIENYNNEEKQALNKLELKFDQNLKQLKDFAEILEQYTQQLLQNLKKFKQQVDQSIEQIIEMKNQVKNKSQDFTNLPLHQTIFYKKTINNQSTQIREQFNNQVKELEICTKLEHVHQSINNLFIKIKDKQKKIKNKMKYMIDKKFDYQLMQQSSNIQNEYCYAIAFNQDSTIMIAGCNQSIKVFEFKEDKPREVQNLNGHSKDVFCLKFMKNSIEFISGSLDSNIIIWKYNKNNQWQIDQVLKGHKSCIWCITSNLNEDMLISGSADKTLNFWNKQNNTWNVCQSIDCQSSIYSISLNDKEDKLIVSVRDNQIQVFQLIGKEWMIKQRMYVEQYGSRLYFINDNQFVFQPRDRQYLQIFDYDLKGKTYKNGQELKYLNQETSDDSLFPIQYLSEIGLVIVKNDNHVHLIKRSQQGIFTVEQSINFHTHILYGCITDDGRFIATWDNKSKEIQIRKFEY